MVPGCRSCFDPRGALRTAAGAVVAAGTVVAAEAGAASAVLPAAGAGVPGEELEPASIQGSRNRSRV